MKLKKKTKLTPIMCKLCAHKADTVNNTLQTWHDKWVHLSIKHFIDEGFAKKMLETEGLFFQLNR